MKVEIRCQPSYAMAICQLAYQETIMVEPEAMVAMSDGIAASLSTGSGGLVKAAMRKKLGGESFFMGKYTAQVGDGAWIALSPRYPGDIGEVQITPQTPLLVESGGLLAHTEGVAIDLRWSGMGNILMREGATMLRVNGTGALLLATYGGLQVVPVGVDQKVVVDTGHLVAFSEGMRMQVKPIAGIVTSQLIGEGLVAEFYGPGNLYLQTRSEDSLRSWILPHRGQNDR